MERLGYHHWYAQVGDLGAAVTEEIPALQPAGREDIHLNFAAFTPTLRRLGGTRPLHGRSTQSRQPHAGAAMRVYAPRRLSVMSPSRHSVNLAVLQNPDLGGELRVCLPDGAPGRLDGYGVVAYALTRNALGLMLLRGRPSSPCGPRQRPPHRLALPRQSRGAAAEVARPPKRLRIVARQHGRLGTGWFCPGSGPWASRGWGLSALGGCPAVTLAG
jgi:microsomal epoxide hydrolase